MNQKRCARGIEYRERGIEGMAVAVGRTSRNGRTGSGSKAVKKCRRRPIRLGEQVCTVAASLFMRLPPPPGLLVGNSLERHLGPMRKAAN